MQTWQFGSSLQFSYLPLLWSSCKISLVANAVGLEEEVRVTADAVMLVSRFHSSGRSTELTQQWFVFHCAAWCATSL